MFAFDMYIILHNGIVVNMFRLIDYERVVTQNKIPIIMRGILLNLIWLAITIDINAMVSLLHLQ